MKIKKFNESKTSVNLKNELADAIVNFINSIYKNPKLNCYSVSAGGGLIFHIIRGNLVFMTIFENNYYSNFGFYLYKASHTNISGNIINFLSSCFDEFAKSLSTNVGYIEFSVNSIHIDKIIDKLTKEDYERFLMKKDVDKYNL